MPAPCSPPPSSTPPGGGSCVLQASVDASRLSGTVMTFAKAADASQKITVSGWSSETHSAVFASGMSAFGAWTSAASPTLAQAKAARAEVWKKAGLAAA